MQPHKIDQFLVRCALVEYRNCVAGQVSQRRDMLNKDSLIPIMSGHRSYRKLRIRMIAKVIYVS